MHKTLTLFSLSFWRLSALCLGWALIAAWPQAQATDLPSAVLPQQSLTSDLMYKLLLAEIAAQRNRFTLAVNTYLEVSRRTHDPRIAERATEVAVFAQNEKAALEAAKLWIESAPESLTARQTLTGILVAAGRLDEAKPHLAMMLSKAQDNQSALFMNMHSLFQREANKEKVLGLIRELAEPYKSLPEAHYAVGLAAIEARTMELAKTEIAKAAQLRPGWESAALLEGQRLLTVKNVPAVVLFYREFLDKYPASQEVRLVYARLLVGEKSYDPARAQFELILKNAPNNPEMAFAVALLSIQLNDLDRAEEYLNRAMSLNYREPDTARFYLGQILEQKNQNERAIETYLSVTPVSDQYVPSRMRIAALYARDHRLSEARDLLHRLPAVEPEQKVLLTQAEAQLLTEAGDLNEARAVLSHGLEENPEASDLLYDRAMIYEKQDDLGRMEEDLRAVIRLKPDYAHAYNALGYTLADRTTRYTEAEELIEKAVKLAPEDAFIMDSLGWVKFRLGRVDEALKILRTAYERQPDPDIVAHLAEVLWAKGDKDAAQKLLDVALRKNPDNRALLDIDKRLKP